MKGMIKKNVMIISKRNLRAEKRSRKLNSISSYYKSPDRTNRSVIYKLLRHEGVKRFVDIVGAIAGLVIFSPVLLIAAVLIYLGGSKRIFFKQERIGRYGKPFMLYKFTTMEDNAHVNSPLVSRASDNRVTKIGKILRVTNINELPQLINVLKGEMSIVGPRPEVPKYVECWSPQIRKKILSVKPGITGYTTVKYWKESVILDIVENPEHYYLYNIVPEKLKLDEWYVENWNLLLDIKIILETLYRAFSGARKGKSIPKNLDEGIEVKPYRRYPRISLNVPVYCEPLDEPVGYSKDISFGGMFIELKNMVQPGNLIQLKFELPDGGGIIKTLARIKWVKQIVNSRQTFGIGVEFVDVSSNEVASLGRFIEHSLSRYLNFSSAERIAC
jgi:lipopolysaccharide/colanic/teichoic acid biosynthesis glycosyltransferase/Tfp pilus assembly protein PilZ